MTGGLLQPEAAYQRVIAVCAATIRMVFGPTVKYNWPHALLEFPFGEPGWISVQFVLLT
jgi:hypothetical protein